MLSPTPAAASLEFFDKIKDRDTSTLGLEDDVTVRPECWKFYKKKDVKKWFGPQRRKLKELLTMVECWTGEGEVSNQVQLREGNAIKLGLRCGQEFSQAAGP